MHDDLVSIIIPTYNRESSIIAAVDSVLNQTYSNLEVIIIDDCSTDNTADLIHQHYCMTTNVIYERLNKNSGACVARNRGILLSRGKYIGFLDSDDEYYNNKIEIQIKALKASGKELCATSYSRLDSKDKKSTVHVVKNSDFNLYEELLYCNFVTTGTLVGNAECFKNIIFDEHLPRYQDWDLVLRLSQKYRFELIDEETLLQKFQPVSITSSTSHEKTFNAMQIIYKKNEEGYSKNRRARTQFLWLKGLHSMYTDSPHTEEMWEGVVGNGFNVKRFTIFILYILGIAKTIGIKF